MAAYTELNAPHKYVEGGLVGADTSSLGCLQVVIHRGRHLPKMDTLGKIDGYVVAHLVSPSDGRRVKTFKTKVQSRDYDPKFKKKKKISLEGWTEYPRIEFELWDRDHLSKDELGGRAVVELGKMGFSGTDPLYKAAIPIALEPKLRPSGGAAVSELVVTVGLFPDYHYTRRCLQRAGRTFYGDGAKRLLVPLANELGPGVELLVEFEGKKKQEVDIKLLQTSDAPSDAVWSDLTFMPDSDGRAIAHKIRREIFSADDVDSHLLPHSRRVSSEKKMDDLGIWTPWNRIVLRAYHYRVLVEQTQAAVHKAHVGPDVDTTQPVDFATVVSQLANGAVADVPDTTVYYPVAATVDPAAAAAQPVAWLSSTFGNKYFDRAVWRHAAADANIFVDAAYGDRRRRTEVYFAEPKLVQSVPCSMRVSVDDIKVPAYRSLFTVRVLQRLPDTIRAVNLPDVLPGVFTTYQRKQKAKDVAHLAHFQGQILPQPADGQPVAPVPDHH